MGKAGLTAITVCAVVLLLVGCGGYETYITGKTPIWLSMLLAGAVTTVVYATFKKNGDK